MKTCIFFLLMSFCSANAQAWSNFIENPYTPYPPGCVTLPGLQTILYGDNAIKVGEKEITLENANDPGTNLPVIMAVYRVACAEPDRSVILAEFRIPDRLDPAVTFYMFPRVAVGYDGEFFPTGNLMQLSAEPNSWGNNDFQDSRRIFGGNTPGTLDGHDRRWVFILDNLSSPQLNDYGSIVTPAIYNNSNLDLVIERIGFDNWWSIWIDTTANLLEANPSIPLSGRLSGTWVVDGASDQGFVISISEMVPDVIPEPDELIDSSLLMFLSWYTFDADGNMLWLTGNAEFRMGATTVTIPIVRVSNGEFRGSKAADREVAGSVTITGNNCNDLTLEYTLNDIGLGAGTKRLQRIYSLETAGFACRDLEARMATK